MPKPIKARMLIRFRDKDAAKADRLRAKLLRKEMKRKDKRGRVVVDIELKEEKKRDKPDPKPKKKRDKPDPKPKKPKP